MSNFINNLVTGNFENFKNDVFETLYSKAGEMLENRKKEIASDLYSNNQESQEDTEIEQPEEE